MADSFEEEMDVDIEETLFGAKSRFDAIWIEAMQKFMFEYFGDAMAEKHDIPMRGMDALVYFLAQKFNWSPVDIKRMTTDEIRLVIAKEYDEWAEDSDCGDLFFEEVKRFALDDEEDDGEI